MGKAKYQQYFDQMFEQNREQFMHFMLLNNAYGQDKREFKQQFDDEGLKVRSLVQEWENKLCKQMENGKNASYSAKLGEKFQDELMKYFPYYHEIGMKIRFADDVE